MALHHIQLEYRKIIDEKLPSRIIIDKLVQIFFQEVNWMYEAIYPSTFLSRYQKWWKDNQSAEIEDIIFATLVLRLCAYTTQFLPSTYVLALGITRKSLTAYTLEHTQLQQ